MSEPAPAWCSPVAAHCRTMRSRSLASSLTSARSLRCGVSEKLNIGQLRQAWVVGSRHDVVAVLAKPCSRDSRVVHIEDELHPAKRPWRRRHAASSSSAAATFSAISSSISVVKSA